MALVEIPITVARVGDPPSRLWHAVDDADVTVQNADGTPRTVYTDETGATAATQPLKSDNGRVDGWVEGGILLRYKAIKKGELAEPEPWQYFVSGGGPIGPAGADGAQGPPGPAGALLAVQQKQGGNAGYANIANGVVPLGGTAGNMELSFTPSVDVWWRLAGFVGLTEYLTAVANPYLLLRVAPDPPLGGTPTRQMIVRLPAASDFRSLNVAGTWGLTAGVAYKATWEWASATGGRFYQDPGYIWCMGEAWTR